MSDTIQVNGQSEPLSAATVAALLDQEKEIDARGVAVALNGAVVPRGAWQATTASRRRHDRDRARPAGRMTCPMRSSSPAAPLRRACSSAPPAIPTGK